MTVMKKGDLVHARTLITEVAKDGWKGPFTTVQIDAPDCRFGAAVEDPCGKPVRHVVVMMVQDGCWAMSLCQHHTEVMEQAIADWRSRD
jgi:hypothetical protein